MSARLEAVSGGFPIEVPIRQLNVEHDVSVGVLFQQAGPTPFRFWESVGRIMDRDVEFVINDDFNAALAELNALLQ